MKVDLPAPLGPKPRRIHRSEPRHSVDEEQQNPRTSSPYRLHEQVVCGLRPCSLESTDGFDCLLVAGKRSIGELLNLHAIQPS